MMTAEPAPACRGGQFPSSAPDPDLGWYAVVQAVLASGDDEKLTDEAKALRREAHSAAWQRLREPAPAPPESDGVCQDSRTRS